MKFFFLCLPFALFAQIGSNGDYQLWQRVKWNAAIRDQWTLKFTEETRYGDNVSKFYYSYIQALIAYQPVRWISIEPGYRQVYKRESATSDNFDFEYSPMMDVILKKSFPVWHIMDRNRVQYLIFQSNENHWVYRNLLRFTNQRKFPLIGMNFYIEDEVFFRENLGFNENRTSLGLSRAMGKHASFDLFYIARYVKSASTWNYNNVFGFNLNFRM